jgi:phage shock protein A
MKFLTRLSDLVSVNLHSLLDQAEDPERMLAHLVRGMEDGLLDARQHAAQALAAQRRLGRELEHQRARRDHWQQQALFALNLGREDLARRALSHKIDHDRLVRELEEQYQSAQDLCTKVKSALATLQHRLTEARGRQSLLVARQRSAQVRAQVERYFTTRSHAPSARFDLLERRIAEREDEMLALVEVSRADDEFDDLERAQRIDEELKRIQAQTIAASAEERRGDNPA